MRYIFNQHKQYREVITIFLNRNPLFPMTDAIPATAICGHVYIGEAPLFKDICVFLTEEETESLLKKILILPKEASMTRF